MRFPRPLVRAVLLRRYKRFLADVRLMDGSEATAHCANPGAMLGVAAAGSEIWLLPSADKRRSLAWSWELTRRISAEPQISSAKSSATLG